MEVDPSLLPFGLSIQVSKTHSKSFFGTILPMQKTYWMQFNSVYFQDFSCLFFHQITLLRNYWKSKVKQEWLSGKYSNVHSQNNLPEKSMYPMDVDTWGEILEAELERWERTAAACNSRTLHQQHMDCQPVNILLFKLVIFADMQRKLHRKKQVNMQITFYLHFIRFTDTKSEILNKTRSLIQYSVVISCL